MEAGGRGSGKGHVGVPGVGAVVWGFGAAEKGRAYSDTGRRAFGQESLRLMRRERGGARTSRLLEEGQGGATPWDSRRGGPPGVREAPSAGRQAREGVGASAAASSRKSELSPEHRAVGRAGL